MTADSHGINNSAKYLGTKLKHALKVIIIMFKSIQQLGLGLAS